MKDTVARMMSTMLRHEINREDAELYAAYRRLEEAGCLRFCLEEAHPGERRRTYVITAVGAKRHRGRNARRRNKHTDKLQEG